MIDAFYQRLASPGRARQVLRQTTIDENGPGTILRDFDTLLAYVMEHPLQVTATGLPPLGALQEVNARLTHPLEHGLRRPVLKSFPHLEGLYLLLRASGLTYIDTAGRKPVLAVDEQALQSWQRLNPTERYGNLLEAWVLHGRPEIIGERGPRYYRIPDHFREALYFLAKVSEDGLQVAGDPGVEDTMLRYYPGAYNVALLELFAIVDVQHAAPEPGKGWRIECIARTPFGWALFSLLQAQFFGDLSNIFELDKPGEVPFGVFQPILQPALPEWRNNLTIPPWAFREGAHIFKVSLGRIWRRIAIPAQAPLDSLASAILNAFDFDYDHLYGFVYTDRSGAEERVVHPAMDEGPYTDEVRVGDLPLRIGQTMTYVYDLGDWWTFTVALEQVDPAMDMRTPKKLASHGEAPQQYPDWE
ncbi:MAG TPA: plasmid pRiA4b ORF-3 family protein [Anaerolineae bacterium]|nr:plasmid pRiA4b ORF-3 family protein [Anaerolineae bacterium]HPL29703.1 plasmid pRiA4b ORF-3 family protein [Anaerolineae bacterium]